MVSFLSRVFSDRYVNEAAIGSNLLLLAMYRFAYPFSVLLIGLRLSPNFITTLSLLCALLAALALALAEGTVIFAAFWGLTVLLDFCDGTVARMFGLYQGIWRFASLPDLQRLVRAIGAVAVLGPVVVWLLQGKGIVPRSVYVLDPILLLMLMGGGRFAYRAWREHREFGSLLAKGKPVFILGAGEAAASLLRELGRSGQWRVVGLLDDNARKHDRTLYGLRVLGAIRDLERFARELKVSHAIIAMKRELRVRLSRPDVDAVLAAALNSPSTTS